MTASNGSESVRIGSHKFEGRLVDKGVNRHQDESEHSASTVSLAILGGSAMTMIRMHNEEYEGL